MKLKTEVKMITVICSGETVKALLKDLKGAVDFVENDFEVVAVKPKKRKARVPKKPAMKAPSPPLSVPPTNPSTFKVNNE